MNPCLLAILLGWNREVKMGTLHHYRVGHIKGDRRNARSASEVSTLIP